MSGPRFKGLGSISPDVVPPPPVVTPASPVSASVPAYPGCDPRFLVPSVERFMGPFRAYLTRMSAFYDSLSLGSYFGVDKTYPHAAHEFGLQRQWDAVKALEARTELLIDRAVPDAEFGKAVASLETSFRTFLSAVAAAMPVQGSLL